MTRIQPALLLALTGLLHACAADTAGGAGSAGGGEGADGKADSSAHAVFLSFDFEGGLVGSPSIGAEKQIESQLLYTVGHLNQDRSLGRLDKVELSDVRTEPFGDRVRITYRATIPVAWNERNEIPETYTFRVPLDVTFDGLERFAEAYGHDCVSGGAHDVDSGVLWYYYRPDTSGCDIAPEDVVELTAAVSPSPLQSHGKYPEYHEIWEDEELRVVAIFGKFREGATHDSDAGISSYNRFVRDVQRELEGFEVVTEPAEIPWEPGVEVPEVHLEARLPDGRGVVVDVLLVENVRTAGPSFDERYEELSRRADYIAYNGHSGLGANIRALAGKGDWVEGQYVVVFMNGCDTYAYVDTSLADAHAAVNPDDSVGTRYVDIVTNAMPAYAHEAANATMTIFRGLLSYDAPLTYEAIFEDISKSQVVLVSGEQDNTFEP